MKFDINSFTLKLISENGISDMKAETVVREKEIDLYISAKEDRPKFIELHWSAPVKNDIFVLGDVWERSYGDLEFKSISENDRYMPWYFIATD